MPFDAPSQAPPLERKKIAQDQQTPEQQAIIEAQRRQQDALEALKQAEGRFLQARQNLSEYQTQAFDAWRDWGFRDPSTFFVYHDGTNGYHVNDYFAENPAQLAQLRQLARAMEDAQSTYKLAADIVQSKMRGGAEPTNVDYVYRYTMPELPKAQAETQPKTLGQALEDWNRGYGQLQEQTQAHFARIQNLFATPFQMPIPGRAASAELPSLQSAQLDQVIASAARPVEQQVAPSARFEPAPEPGAAFARPDEVTQQFQIPTMPTTPQPAQKTPWYKRVASSLFR